MSEHADPLIALLLEALDEEYMESILELLNIEVEYVQREKVYKIGNGLKMLIISGFSLYDYKIVNSIILYAINQNMTVRNERALPRRFLENKLQIMMYPVVNKYAYSRYAVKNKMYRRSIMDEKGVHIVYDAFSLSSRYSRNLHNIIKTIRPNILLTAISDKTLDLELRKPVINIETLNCELDITELKRLGIDIEQIFENYELIQLPYSHYTFENLTDVGIILIIPNEYTIKNIYKIILSIIETIGTKISLVKSEEVRKINTREVELRCNIESVNMIKEILNEHGIEIVKEEDGKIVLRYDIHNRLHRELFENRLIEYYLDVEIIS